MPERPALIFISEYSDTRGWQRQLAKYLPEIETRIWPDIGQKKTSSLRSSGSIPMVYWANFLS